MSTDHAERTPPSKDQGVESPYREWARLRLDSRGDVESGPCKPTASGLAEVTARTLDDGGFLSITLIANLNDDELLTMEELLLDHGVPRLDPREPTCMDGGDVPHIAEPRGWRRAADLAAAVLQIQVRQMLVDGVPPSRWARSHTITDAEEAANRLRSVARRCVEACDREGEETGRIGVMLMLPILDPGSPIPTLDEMAERINRDVDHTRSLLRRAHGIRTRVAYIEAAKPDPW